MEIPSLAGKCPETLPDFALKREHLPRVLSTSRNMPGKTAPHLAHDIQFKLAAVDSFLHLSSPCLFLMYDILEKLTSISVRSYGFSPNPEPHLLLTNLTFGESPR